MLLFIAAVIFFLFIGPRKILNFLKIILNSQKSCNRIAPVYPLPRFVSLLHFAKFVLSQERQTQTQTLLPRTISEQITDMGLQQTLIFSVYFLRMNILGNLNIIIKFRKFNIDTMLYLINSSYSSLVKSPKNGLYQSCAG